MRLGDLDHLLLKLDAELSDDARYIDIADQIREIIDNAPTVMKDYDTGYQDGLEDGLNDIRPKGDWICVTKSTFPQYQPDEYKCSNCNKLCHIKYYYCPFCGADMRGDSHG